MKSSMIFHHPLPVNPDGNSGSRVRPYQMVEAFQHIGYEVEMVTGYGGERKKAVKKIRSDVKKGRKFDFIYSESSTMPTLLTEPHHLPIYPFLDFGFFRWAKKKKIPVGLFYRDISWRFDIYKRGVPWYKRVISIPFYWYDWLAYLNILNYLFLPSLLMKDVLPTNWPESKLSTLPPGGKIVEVKRDAKKKCDIINLIYIGGVQPPVYNLTPMFKTIESLKEIENIELKLCCRNEEWQSVEKFYKSFLKQNIKLVHFSKRDLQEFYNNADIFLLLREKCQYLYFAMPVKVLESLGYGVPILTLSGTEAARFILKEDIGWVVNTIEGAKDLLLNLIENPKKIEAKRQKVIEAQVRHTWEARALKVAKTLTKEKNEI